jgi:hypothetical protein
LNTDVNVPTKRKVPVPNRYKTNNNNKLIFGWHLGSHRRKKQDPDPDP